MATLTLMWLPRAALTRFWALRWLHLHWCGYQGQLSHGSGPWDDYTYTDVATKGSAHTALGLEMTALTLMWLPRAAITRLWALRWLHLHWCGYQGLFSQGSEPWDDYFVYDDYLFETDWSSYWTWQLYKNYCFHTRIFIAIGLIIAFSSLLLLKILLLLFN